MLVLPDEAAGISPSIILVKIVLINTLLHAPSSARLMLNGRARLNLKALTGVQVLQLSAVLRAEVRHQALNNAGAVLVNHAVVNRDTR